jgi:hypothetical protein
LQTLHHPRPHQRRYASNSNLPFTEKIRRKIWGTDNPPGLADPYGGPSFLERRRMEREQREKGEQRAQALPEEEAETQEYLEPQREMTQQRPNIVDREFEDDDFGHQEYEPAQTWDGLPHIGHRGNWKDIPPKPEDEYQP